MFKRLLLGLLFALISTPALAKLGVYGKLDVWAISETRKILRGGNAERNKKVVISVAKNEWESFQIFLRSSGKPVNNINLIPSDLLSDSGDVIPLKNAKLYRVDQIYISRGSTGMANNFFFRPDWYPDALIPFDVPNENAELTAVPFNLPKNETHGFFIDIYISKDTKPGVYKGTYILKANDDAIAEIPVSLTVWDFELPSTPTLSTDFGAPFQRFKNHYPRVSGKSSDEIDFNAANLQIMNLLVEHKINPQEVPNKEGLRPVETSTGDYYIDKKIIDEVRNYIDVYMVNSIRVGRIGSPLKLCRKEVCSSSTLTEEEKVQLRKILKAFDVFKYNLKRDVELYSYLFDEPKGKFDYDFVRNVGGFISRNSSSVKVLVTEQTRPEEGLENLYDAVDIWVSPFKLFDYRNSTRRRSNGDTIWSYTTLGRWQTDYPLINYRIPTWISWYYGVNGLLYWSVDFWDSVDDPWTEPSTWCKSNDTSCTENLDHPSLYNGEGVLVYPAHKVGFDGIVPSLRLKAIRDSIEDYEYLTILDKKGLASEARELIKEIFNESPSSEGRMIRNFYIPNYKDPTPLHEMREKLAEMILKTEN